LFRPCGARPRAETRPPVDAEYAWSADEFVPPDFAGYFNDDQAAGMELDRVFADRAPIELADRELLEPFRRGLRRSENPPNSMFGWIIGSLGWPQDPMLTEIFYQATDPGAPGEVRDAAIYYGVGLGVAKTKNMLEAMFRVFMAPPFDRTSNGNLRQRILWGLGKHEDDKHYLATRFADTLRNHASLTDEALLQADAAYRQLTGEVPPHAIEYAARGLFVVIARDPDAHSAEPSKQLPAPIWEIILMWAIRRGASRVMIPS
jgi:hypothetical protein